MYLGGTSGVVYIGDNNTVDLCFLRPHLCTNGYSISLWIKSLYENEAVQGLYKPILNSEYLVNYQGSAGITLLITGKYNITVLYIQVSSDSKAYQIVAHLERGKWYHVALVTDFGKNGVTGSTAAVQSYIDGCMYMPADPQDREGPYDADADENYRSLSLGHVSDIVVTYKNLYHSHWPDDIFDPYNATHAMIDEIFMVEKQLSAEEVWSLYSAGLRGSN